MLLPRQTTEEDVLVENDALGQGQREITADPRFTGPAGAGHLEERETEERPMVSTVVAHDGWLVRHDDLVHPFAALLADSQHWSQISALPARYLSPW
jgi:hypothetical protein